jgi:hypothetical protein
MSPGNIVTATRPSLATPNTGILSRKGAYKTPPILPFLLSSPRYHLATKIDHPKVDLPNLLLSCSPNLLLSCSQNYPAFPVSLATILALINSCINACRRSESRFCCYPNITLPSQRPLRRRPMTLRYLLTSDLF